MKGYRFHVPKDGRLSTADRSQCAAAIRAFAGKPLEIVFRTPRTQRSLDQNAYLHCDTGPARLMAEEWGVSMDEAKFLLMGECWGWKEVNGVRLPVKPHTSDMTVQEFSYFVEWVIPWALVEFGVHIMLPNEQAA